MNLHFELVHTFRRVFLLMVCEEVPGNTEGWIRLYSQGATGCQSIWVGAFCFPATCELNLTPLVVRFDFTRVFDSECGASSFPLPYIISLSVRLSLRLKVTGTGDDRGLDPFTISRIIELYVWQLYILPGWGLFSKAYNCYL